MKKIENEEFIKDLIIICEMWNKWVDKAKDLFSGIYHNVEWISMVNYCKSNRNDLIKFSKGILMDEDSSNDRYIYELINQSLPVIESVIRREKLEVCNETYLRLIKPFEPITTNINIVKREKKGKGKK